VLKQLEDRAMESRQCLGYDVWITAALQQRQNSIFLL